MSDENSRELNINNNMNNQKRGPWSPEEDRKLLELISMYGPSNWVRISTFLGTRTAKQCRERYHQNLKPSLNRSPITPEEGAYIEELVERYGKRWAEIARHLNGRSDNAIKNWWNGGANRRRRASTQATLQQEQYLSNLAQEKQQGSQQQQLQQQQQQQQQPPQSQQQHSQQQQQQHQHHQQQQQQPQPQSVSSPLVPNGHHQSIHLQSQQVPQVAQIPPPPSQISQSPLPQHVPMQSSMSSISQTQTPQPGQTMGTDYYMNPKRRLLDSRRHSTATIATSSYVSPSPNSITNSRNSSFSCDTHYSSNDNDSLKSVSRRSSIIMDSSNLGKRNSVDLPSYSKIAPTNFFNGHNETTQLPPINTYIQDSLSSSQNSTPYYHSPQSSINFRKNSLPPLSFGHSSTGSVINLPPLNTEPSIFNPNFSLSNSSSKNSTPIAPVPPHNMSNNNNGNGIFKPNFSFSKVNTKQDQESSSIKEENEIEEMKNAKAKKSDERITIAKLVD